MGTEYWVVKPSNKTLFYLGKRLHEFTGIYPKLNFIDYETPHDLLVDIIDNCLCFVEEDMTIGQLINLAIAIFEFCNDKVFIGNDCSDDCEEWLNWNEEDVFYEYFREE